MVELKNELVFERKEYRCIFKRASYFACSHIFRSLNLKDDSKTVLVIFTLSKGTISFKANLNGQTIKDMNFDIPGRYVISISETGLIQTIICLNKFCIILQ